MVRYKRYERSAIIRTAAVPAMAPPTAAPVEIEEEFVSDCGGGATIVGVAAADVDVGVELVEDAVLDEEDDDDDEGGDELGVAVGVGVFVAKAPTPLRTGVGVG